MTVPRTTADRQATQTQGGALATVWIEMREGVVYLFSNRTMVGVLLCLAVVQLGVGAINVVWVPFMQRTFGLGPEGLGAVDAAQGVGMALGGAMLGLVAGRFPKKNLAGWSIFFIGGMIALIGMSPPFSVVNLIPGLEIEVSLAEMSVGQRLLHMPLLLLLYSLLLGIALTPAQSALMTMMQLAVPDLKRGRVGSAMNALVMAAGLTSMAVAAASGEVAELRMIYAVAGVTVSAGGLVGLAVLQEPERMLEDSSADEAGDPAAVLAD